MSADEPKFLATPLTPELTDEEIERPEDARMERSRRARQNEDYAKKLSSVLEPLAKKLGLKIRVTHDTLGYAWRIDAALIVPRCNVSIDEEVFYAAPSGRAITDLISFEMDGLQLRVFDEARRQMDALDVRQRIANLSREDKDTLHEMLDDATRELLKDFRYGAGDQYAKAEATRRKYEQLVMRLSR